jgi:hypothetical protein
VVFGLENRGVGGGRLSLDLFERMIDELEKATGAGEAPPSVCVASRIHICLIMMWA